MLCICRFAASLVILLAVSAADPQGSAAGYGQGSANGFGAGRGGGGGMGGYGGGNAGLQDAPSNVRPEDDQTAGLWQSRVAILTPGDRVEYKFNMVAGETIFAAVSSDAFDPALAIDDAKGKELAKNDDRVEGDQSPFLIYRTTAAGTYTLKVLSYRSVSGGKFTLRFRTFRAADAGFGLALYKNLTPTEMPGDRYVFRITARKGMYYDLGYLNSGDGYLAPQPKAATSGPGSRDRLPTTITSGSDHSGIFLGGPDPYIVVHDGQFHPPPSERKGDGVVLLKPVPPMNFDGTNIRDALRAIFKLAGVSYEIDPSVQGQVTLTMKEGNFETLLDATLDQVDSTWRTEGGVFQITRNRQYAMRDSTPLKVNDESKYRPIGSRFLDLVGPTGVQSSDFETVPTSDGTTVFLAKADGDYYAEFSIEEGNQVGTEFREFSATPTTTSSDQAVNLEPRELRILEFKVMTNQAVRTSLTGQQITSLVSSTTNSVGSLTGQLSVTPPVETGNPPADVSEAIIPEFVAEDTDIRDALHALFGAVRVSYEVDPQVQGSVSGFLKNVKFETALRDVLDQVKATWRVEGGVYQIILRQDGSSAAADVGPVEAIQPYVRTEVESLQSGADPGYGDNRDWTWFKMNVDFDTDVVRVFKTQTVIRLVVRSTSREKETIRIQNDDALPVWEPGHEQTGSIEIGDSRLYLLKSTKSELMTVAAQAKNFQLKMEIFKMSGERANTLEKRRSHTVGDNLYFPDAAPFIVRISCDGNGGSGDFGIRRDTITATPYSLGSSETLKLDGGNFGLFSMDLVAGKRYELITDRPIRSDLLDDDGNFLTSQDLALDKVFVRYFVPTKSGRHRLWIRGQAGAYRFKLEPNVPPSLGS